LREALFVLAASAFFAGGASAAGLHDFYQQDDKEHAAILKEMEGWRVPDLPGECPTLIKAEGRKINRFEIAMAGKVAKAWKNAKSSDGHKADDAAHSALFDVGAGGHRKSLEDRGGLEHPGNTSERSPTARTAGFGAAGAVMDPMHKFSLLCKGHKFMDPKPGAVPLREVIKEQGAAALKEFNRRAEAAEDTAKLIGELEADMSHTARTLASTEEGKKVLAANDAPARIDCATCNGRSQSQDAALVLVAAVEEKITAQCFDPLQEWYQKWKGAVASARELKDRVASTGESYTGRGQALDKQVQAALSMAEDICNDEKFKSQSSK
jgi:hypothetical protein